jgi:hypothetical protein
MQPSYLWESKELCAAFAGLHLEEKLSTAGAQELSPTHPPDHSQFPRTEDHKSKVRPILDLITSNSHIIPSAFQFHTT